MGFKTKGGMWCDACRMPVAGQKGTHRTRGAVVALTALPTAGLSLVGARSDAYHCPQCGGPVRRATRADLQPAPPPARHVSADDGRTASVWVGRHPSTPRVRDFTALGNTLAVMGVHGQSASRQWGESLPTSFGPFPSATAEQIASSLRAIGFPVDLETADVEEHPSPSTNVTCVLQSAGDKKIQVIKILRATFGWDLRRSKEAIDRVPIELVVDPSRADQLVAELRAVGATVDVERQRSPAAPPDAPRSSVVDELTKLAELHAAGALTDAEFATLKQRLIAHG